MKVGALIYVRPMPYDCVLYRHIEARHRQAYQFADRDDAQRYADQNNLVAVHDDRAAAQGPAVQHDAAMSTQQGQVQEQRQSAGDAGDVLADADLADSEGGHHD